MLISVSHADDFPNRAIMYVVPYATGSTADNLGRVIAKGMEHELGKPVVVENRSGAGALIGANYVARSKPDGYTILFGAGSTHTTPQAITANMPYDPLKDFAPIAMIGSTSYVLYANPNLPFKNLKDLIKYAKLHPGKVSFGSSGTGTASHLAMEHLEKVAGIRLLHIPYRGGGQILVDLMGGQIDLGVSTAESAHLAKSGKIQPIAILGTKRLSALSNVQTCYEQGVADCGFPVWNALFAPSGTPKSTMDKLTAAANAAIESPAIQKRLREFGYEPSGPISAEEIQRRIKKEINFVNTLAKEAGIVP